MVNLQFTLNDSIEQQFTNIKRNMFTETGKLKATFEMMVKQLNQAS